jgi:RNA polymerase sigma factor for flagellar operon FliA
MTEAQLRGMWNDYARGGSTELKRRLVLQYLNLVRYVVSKFGLYAHGRSHGLEKEDMIHYGILGLVNAIDRFSPTMGVKFETYAVPRIRGAILDELRKLDWVPRSVRTNRRRREQAAAKVSQEVGREPVDEEIAGKLAMTLDEYRQFMNDSGGTYMEQETGGGPPGDRDGVLENVTEESPNPFEQLTDEESKAMLLDAVAKLPEREKTIVVLYYYEGLKFLEIGKILRVSESRVSQIHSEVLGNLRRVLLTRQ